MPRVGFGSIRGMGRRDWAGGGGQDGKPSIPCLSWSGALGPCRLLCETFCWLVHFGRCARERAGGTACFRPAQAAHDHSREKTRRVPTANALRANLLFDAEDAASKQTLDISLNCSTIHIKEIIVVGSFSLFSVQCLPLPLPVRSRSYLRSTT